MVSKHIADNESECRCGCGQRKIDTNLVKMYELFRTYIGEYYGYEIFLPIHCLNRCGEHNRKIGGSKTSKHLKGSAVDFHARGIKILDLHHIARNAHDNRSILSGGLGLYDWGVHIDSGKFRSWGDS